MAYNLPSHPVFFNPVLLWTDLAMKTTEMLVSSGQVIGSRLDQMARAGANPGPNDTREMLLMGSEKVKAGTESSLAIVARLQAANIQLITRAWQQWFASLGALAALGTSRGLGPMLSNQNRLASALHRSGKTQARISSDSARLANAAIKPVHAAATANARRLTRGKTRRTPPRTSPR